jgi:hypothetical protein
VPSGNRTCCRVGSAEHPSGKRDVGCDHERQDRRVLGSQRRVMVLISGSTAPGTSHGTLSDLISHSSFVTVNTCEFEE